MRTKVVATKEGGIVVPLTEAEEIIRDDEEAVALANRPPELTKEMGEWQDMIALSDNTIMPRYLEDLITDNPTLVVNEYTQVKYDAKIKLREDRP